VVTSEKDEATGLKVCPIHEAHHAMRGGVHEAVHLRIREGKKGNTGKAGQKRVVFKRQKGPREDGGRMG